MREEASTLLVTHQAADDQRCMFLIDTLVSDRGDGAKVLDLLTLLALPVQMVLSLLATLSEGDTVTLTELTKLSTDLQEGKKKLSTVLTKPLCC
jgi:hypothetical protein